MTGAELESRTHAARARLGLRSRQDFERIAALLAIGLGRALRRPRVRPPSEALPLPAYFQVGIGSPTASSLAAVIASSRHSMSRGWSRAEARRLTPALGAWLWGVFRFEIMAAHCRALDMAAVHVERWTGSQVRPLSRCWAASWQISTSNGATRGTPVH